MIPSASQGRRLFEQKGCIACHSLDGNGGLRRTLEWMVQQAPGLLSGANGYTKTLYSHSCMAIVIND